MAVELRNRFLAPFADHLDLDRAERTGHGRLRSAGLTKSLVIAGVRLPAGSTLRFLEEPARDVLTEAVVVGATEAVSVRCKPGAVIGFFDLDPPALWYLSKAFDQVIDIQGLPADPGRTVTFHADGDLAKITLGRDALIEGVGLGKGSTIQFPRGLRKAPREFYARLGRAREFRGIAFPARTEIGIVQGRLQTACAPREMRIGADVFAPDTVIRFDPDGRVDRVAMFMSGTIGFDRLSPAEQEEYFRRQPGTGPGTGTGGP